MQAAQNIDTGMGLERVAQILQGVPNNYETDLLFPLLAEAARLAGIDYSSAPEKTKTSLKVIADHIRACVYLISDGVTPSNVGRGYVLRRLIRRVVLKVVPPDRYPWHPRVQLCRVQLLSDLSCLHLLGMGVTQVTLWVIVWPRQLTWVGTLLFHFCPCCTLVLVATVSLVLRSISWLCLECPLLPCFCSRCRALGDVSLFQPFLLRLCFAHAYRHKLPSCLASDEGTPQSLLSRLCHACVTHLSHS